MRIDEFLLARIAEDEAVVRLAIASRQDLGVYAPPGIAPDFLLWACTDEIPPYLTIGMERMLAECEAKRAIVEQALLIAEQVETMHPNHGWRASMEGQALSLRIAVRHLAAVYADHPDYRVEWRA